MIDDGQWRIGWEELLIVIPLIVFLTVVNHLLDAYELSSTRTRGSAAIHPGSVGAAKTAPAPAETGQPTRRRP